MKLCFYFLINRLIYKKLRFYRFVTAKTGRSTWTSLKLKITKTTQLISNKMHLKVFTHRKLQKSLIISIHGVIIDN